MEYEFIHDSITGEAKAKFSFEHEVIGPWIEIELGNDEKKLTELLTLIDQIENRTKSEMMITGSEYSILINYDDIQIQSNASLNGTEELPELLTNDHIHFDESDCASCGIDDFKKLLLSWGKFTQEYNKQPLT